MPSAFGGADGAELAVSILAPSHSTGMADSCSVTEPMLALRPLSYQSPPWHLPEGFARVPGREWTSLGVDLLAA